jgi:hypothetical protein
MRNRPSASVDIAPLARNGRCAGCDISGARVVTENAWTLRAGDRLLPLTDDHASHGAAVWSRRIGKRALYGETLRRGCGGCQHCLGPIDRAERQLQQPSDHR